MEYQLIFTNGYSDDIESLSRDLRCDVLILTQHEEYYNPQYITIQRIISEFDRDEISYLQDNLVILHEVTRENILKSMPKIHKWQFKKRWHPLTTEHLEKYFYPQDNWVVIKVNIDDTKIDAD